MNNPLVQPDPGLFIWTILTFLVLLGLLAKFAWKPLLAALDKRQQMIAQTVEDAKQAREEIERARQESAQVIAKARVDAEAVLARTQADAARFHEEMRQKAIADAQAVVQRAEREIELEKQRAIKQIRHEAVDLSLAIASKLLRRNVTKEDNLALIDDTIKQIQPAE
ncbi:MAG TPA: F0F1 ATP synthase subunit B [Vicinamibacterales bacterium]|nr:F0F1 ATP synthase subunit B [Vicinamibacterales bacterium]